MGMVLPGLASADEPPFEISRLHRPHHRRRRRRLHHRRRPSRRNLTEFTFPATTDSLGNSVPFESLKDASVTLPPGFFGNPAAAPRCPFEGITTDSEGTDTSTCPPGSQVGTVAIDSGIQPRRTQASTLQRHPPARLSGRSSPSSTSHANKVVLFVEPLPRTASYGLEVGSSNVGRGRDHRRLHQLLRRPLPARLRQHPKPPSSPTRSTALKPNRPGRSPPTPGSTPAPTSPAASPTSPTPTGRPASESPRRSPAAMTRPSPPSSTPRLGTKPLQRAAARPRPISPPASRSTSTSPSQTTRPIPNTTFDPSIPQAPEPKDITVKLPAGLAISPPRPTASAPAPTRPPTPPATRSTTTTPNRRSCPDASKIGTVSATSPLLAAHEPVTDDIVGPEPIPGSVYLLKPHPGDLPVGGGNQDGKFRLLIQLENAALRSQLQAPRDRHRRPEDRPADHARHPEPAAARQPHHRLPQGRRPGAAGEPD